MKKSLRIVFTCVIILIVAYTIMIVFVQQPPVHRRISNLNSNRAETPSARSTTSIALSNHLTPQSGTTPLPTASSSSAPGTGPGSGSIPGSNPNTSSSSSSSSSGSASAVVTTGMPHVYGTQLINASGHPFMLRGAHIESSLNYSKSWSSGSMPTSLLTSTLFFAMSHSWGMNAVRLPVSNWIYAQNPTVYMSQLDQVIQRANAAGLYVILDLHDNAKSGSPYGANALFPKPENVSFWHTIAAHYKNNPMLMFDLFNEPHSSSWLSWLHGGGTSNGATIVGMQDLVNAIRSAGAKQIIVVEPVFGLDWSSVGPYTINDPNIIYSAHIYSHIAAPASTLDASWGPILNHHPMYFGEWGAIVNTYTPIQCSTIPPAQADQIVNNFLNYMASRGINWTAWEFTPYHLIQDYTTFAPTTLDIPWTCGDTSSHAGMGTLVKHFLTGR